MGALVQAGVRWTTGTDGGSCRLHTPRRPNEGTTTTDCHALRMRRYDVGSGRLLIALRMQDPATMTRFSRDPLAKAWPV
jgi:hypothetical protein